MWEKNTARVNVQGAKRRVRRAPARQRRAGIADKPLMWEKAARVNVQGAKRRVRRAFECQQRAGIADKSLIWAEMRLALSTRPWKKRTQSRNKRTGRGQEEGGKLFPDTPLFRKRESRRFLRQRAVKLSPGAPAASSLEASSIDGSISTPRLPCGSIMADAVNGASVRSALQKAFFPISRTAKNQIAGREHHALPAVFVWRGARVGDTDSE